MKAIVSLRNCAYNKKLYNKKRSYKINETNITSF